MNKKLFAGLATALFMFGMIGSANAALVERDFLVTGDNLLTYDTESGLEWLDLEITRGMSYSEVESELVNGGSLEGFSIANAEQMTELYLNGGFTYPLGPNIFNDDTAMDQIKGLISLFGNTITDGREDMLWISRGFITGTSSGNRNSSMLLAEMRDIDPYCSAGIEYGNFYMDYKDNHLGSWLYRKHTQGTIPVAAAGPNQAIIQIDTIVYLDGSESYDLEGDPITFSWTIVSLPPDSNATLSAPASPTPMFRADIHGDYVLELVVSDASSSSEPDQVTISFENVIPIANAGTNQSVVQGETVCFDGSLSSDANLDSLSYSWSLSFIPEGSSTSLDNPIAIFPCITTDQPGNYEASLVVNDGLVDSESSAANVFAIAYLDATTMTLQETVSEINAINLDEFKNKKMQNTLTNKVNAALELADQGSYAEALDKLQHDILGKTDGCASSGSPDKNDWITDCPSQNQIYPLLMEAIGYLQNM